MTIIEVTTGAIDPIEANITQGGHTEVLSQEANKRATTDNLTLPMETMIIITTVIINQRRGGHGYSGNHFRPHSRGRGNY